MSCRPSLLVLPLALACGGGNASPDDTDADTDVVRQTEAFPRCADHDPGRRPLFGDLHVHTARSLDAYLQGNRLSPADAYRFARGERLDIQPFDAEGRGTRSLQLDRPLDFAAVTDHAEFLGTLALCLDPASPAYEDRECVQVRDRPALAFVGLNAATAQDQADAQFPGLCGDAGADCLTAGLDVWEEERQATEAAYDRTEACTFTSLHAYEWSGGPTAQNLHRNVIFRNEAVPDLPVGYFDESYPEGLWSALERDCLGEAPCDVLAIPHNANLSTGLMFRTPGDGTPPLTAAEAARRAAFEPLVEIFQHKGDGECWPGSPVSDELCDFEKLPYNNLASANLGAKGEPLARDFVRDVLGEGLRYQSTLGVDPYRLGIIAGTDTHLGTPGATDEASYPGHGGAGQANREAIVGLPDGVPYNPGGLAVVWAEENSREAIFRALKRRETYGTSGPRLVLRFWGGDLAAGACEDPDLVAHADAKGVPMGGLMPGSGATFVVQAAADPGGASRAAVPLQRLQIVKGWVEDGEVRSTVIDVAGDAGTDPLDRDTCLLSGEGPTTLCGTWTDPDHDPSVPAFWYARVVEVPTCRWQRAQCLAAGITCPTQADGYEGCCDDEVPDTLQERAWSSPIWNLPEGG
ncbi:MAG: DUF3604 domain-containing protein [Alphaproteobacteria bacterium]|nr:DUF3604 domain-containing protein [Alphaproteobacteria bacterium]